MITNFEKMLMDNSVVDIMCNTRFSNMIIHKDFYKDRFIILYTKNCKNGLFQNNFEYAGCFDTKEKVMYNVSDILGMIIPEDIKFRYDNFDSLGRKIIKEIDLYVKDIVFKNEEVFKDAAIEKYNHDDDYRRNGYHQTVEREFITKAEPEILYPEINSDRFINRNDYSYDRFLHENYLFNPEETIKKQGDMIIENEKCELGFNLLLFEAKKEYLEKIKENKDNKFEHLHINKRILDALRQVDARTVNITINYDGNELTFKYNCDDLKYSLSRSKLKANSFGNSFGQIKDFFEHNNIRDEYGYMETEFSFKNITSITHGKNILYIKEPDIKKEIIEEELDEIER